MRDIIIFGLGFLGGIAGIVAVATFLREFVPTYRGFK
jgi:hypothetical protein